jgi:hypothetical protein
METMSMGGDRCSVGTSGPCVHLLEITPDDTTEYDPPLRYVRVENVGGGTLVIVAAGDEVADARTFTMAQYAEFDRIAIKQIRAASTATTIIGGW